MPAPDGVTAGVTDITPPHDDALCVPVPKSSFAVQRQSRSFPGFPSWSARTPARIRRQQVPLEPDLTQWADVIFVIERSHKNRIVKKFKTFPIGKPIVVLDILDEYEFMNPELVRLLQKNAAPLLCICSDS